jgi:predicted permease
MSDLRHELRTRIAGLGLRPEREAEIVEELSQHLDDRMRELVAGGANADAARAAALGDLAAPGELARRLAEIETRPRLNLPAPGARSRGRWLARRWMDLRVTMRGLRHARGFTATVVITMALTIGPMSAILSIGNWLLWRPTPGVRDADRIAVVWTGNWSEDGTSIGFSPAGISNPNLQDLRAASKTLAAIAGAQEGLTNLAAGDLPSVVAGTAWVTANYFETLGVTLAAGRTFRGEDDLPPYGSPVAVISHALAVSAYGGAEAALGRELKLNGRPIFVVGVAARGFVGTTPFSRVDVWYPGTTYFYVHHSTRPRTGARTEDVFYTFVARLAPGASFDHARAELDVLVPALADRHPTDNESFRTARARLFEGLGPYELQRGRYKRLVTMLVAIGGALLLLGCANVANLMILRGIRGQGERAVRIALGASRGSLAWLRLTESVLVSAAGATGGVLLAVWLKEFLSALIVPGLSEVTAVSIPMDVRVLVMTLAASTVCGLLAGAAPALIDGFGRSVTSPLAAGGRGTGGGRRIRLVFAAAQLALSLALVTGALLFVTTVQRLRAVDLGFESDGVSVHVIDPDSQGYTPERRHAYLQDLARRVSASSGIERASLSILAPFGNGRSMRVANPAGLDRPPIEVHANAVTAEYFDVLAMSPIRGRYFTREEALALPGSGTPIVIVSDGLSRRLFGAADPVGRTIVLPRTSWGVPERRLAIVGVAPDALWHSLTDEPEPYIYLPFTNTEFGGRSATLLTRSPLPARDVAAIVADAARQIDPTLPIRFSEPIAARIDEEIGDRRVFAWVLSMLGWLGFILAAVGLFGLLSQSVHERWREIGIRIAIGSDQRRIVSLIMRQALWIGVAGTAAGLGLAALGSRLVASQLVGVSSLEPRVYAGAAAALAVVVFAAAAWPAWMATRVDPVEALRSE